MFALPILAAFSTWFGIQSLSKLISPLLFPDAFKTLSSTQKLNWDLHVVSTVHALVASFSCIPIFFKEELQKDRLFGFNEYAGYVYAMSIG